MINVLIVEDSITAQNILASILTADPEIQIMGTVQDGIEALEFLKNKQPDVITMDLQMPRMNGVEVTRRIMQSKPVPIVIVSAFWTPGNKELAFQFMEAGAVCAVEKPHGKSREDYQRSTKTLVQTVKSMSEIKLVKRRPTSPVSVPAEDAEATKTAGTQVEIVGIGASTGGPPVLRDILSRVPKEFPVPIVVVQHIASGFLQGMVDWLSASLPLKIRICEQGMPLLPGTVYFAPDDYHLQVSREKKAMLSQDPPDHGLRPSVAHLFRSLADNLGSRSIGILLTGMGSDGSKELKLMRNSGARTIAQDESTSIVFGMPGEAIRLGGATYVLPPDEIAIRLCDLMKVSAESKR